MLKHCRPDILSRGHLSLLHRHPGWWCRVFCWICWRNIIVHQGDWRTIDGGLRGFPGSQGMICPCLRWNWRHWHWRLLEIWVHRHDYNQCAIDLLLDKWSTPSVNIWMAWSRALLSEILWTDAVFGRAMPRIRTVGEPPPFGIGLFQCIRLMRWGRKVARYIPRTIRTCWSRHCVICCRHRWCRPRRCFLFLQSMNSLCSGWWGKHGGFWRAIYQRADRGADRCIDRRIDRRVEWHRCLKLDTHIIWKYVYNDAPGVLGVQYMHVCMHVCMVVISRNLLSPRARIEFVARNRARKKKFFLNILLITFRTNIISIILVQKVNNNLYASYQVFGHVLVSFVTYLIY